MKILIAFGLALIAVACAPPPNQDSKDAAIVRNQQTHYSQVQPIPYYDFSMDRDTLIQIYNAKNEARVTHSVIYSSGTGEVLWDCPSIGYPLPADAQLTNPLTPTIVRVQRPDGVWEVVDGVVEQPEPNGVYSSKNTDATYVLCVRPDGSVNPVYTEQKITTYPFKVQVVNGKVVDAGEQSTITVDVKSGSVGEAPVESAAPSPAN